MSEASPPTGRFETLDLDRCVRHREQVLHKVLEGEAVVLDLSAGAYFGLDQVGTRIWELLDGRSLQEVREAILDEFEVDAATAERDLLKLVGELAEKDLVVVD